ncbi:MAG: FAD-dependent monooxygenase [Pigmentiphaga sp.]|nr:FAD-dependent monooxygenase [Pigmentiphaga sp.]
MKRQRILVVGAGIGGATAAYTLSRAGHDVDCIEIKPQPVMAGTGICLLHNTLSALRAIGLEAPCLEYGFPFQVFRQFTSAGEPVMNSPAPPACGIRRVDLARVLETAAADAGAKLRRGTSVAQLDNTPERVVATLNDGTKKEYDLVIAADGAYSKTRAAVFGRECEARFAGQSVWRFNARRPAEIDGFCLYRTPDGKRVVGSFPTSPNDCYIFYLENSSEHMHLPADSMDALLRERLSEFRAPAIQEALAGVERPEQVVFRPLDITLVPRPWHRHRVALLGDAAHAPTPQMTSGGGMAIEDAVVMAQCLEGAESMAEALEGYCERRFDRCKTIYDASLQLCLWEQEAVPNPPRSAELLLKTYQFLGQPY